MRAAAAGGVPGSPTLAAKGRFLVAVAEGSDIQRVAAAERVSLAAHVQQSKTSAGQVGSSLITVRSRQRGQRSPPRRS